MLARAIKANLPLISIKTRDLMHLTEMVKFQTGKTIHKAEAISSPTKINEGQVFYVVHPDPKEMKDSAKLYAQYAKAGSSLLLVNAEKVPQEAFDAGELNPTREEVEKMLNEAFPNNDEWVQEILPTLGGLTMKEVGEVIKLTEATFDVVSAQGITRTRAQLVPDMAGFSAVNTTIIGPYLPNAELEAFAAKKKKLFLSPNMDPRLVPKGALFDGETGTGKTQGAKWLASQWGVPMYRLDSSIMQKYYGESEQSLKSIFSRVAVEAPCILFIDEVEKIFGKSHEEGHVPARLLGMLLWFMQESTERVFVAMTSNRRELLPEEMLRPGRIDTVLTFRGLPKEEAIPFAKTILKSFKIDKVGLAKEVEAKITGLFEQGIKAGKPLLSHAVITQTVLDVVSDAEGA